MSFLAFEGIDGSGKSTLIKALCENLQKKGFQPVVTREPGGTFVGERIRSILLEKTDHPPDPYTEILLYYADRHQHISEIIRPQLKKGAFLISDRYWASTFAYQCGGRQIDEAFVSHIHQKICEPSCDPDLWILLDLPVEKSLERLSKNSEKKRDRFELEEKDFHQRIRDYYLKLSQKKSESWLVLDATQESQKLLEEILSSLKERNLLESER